GPTSNFEDYEARRRELGEKIASGEGLSPAGPSPDDTWRMLEQTRKLEEMRRDSLEALKSQKLVNAPAEILPAPAGETTGWDVFSPPDLSLQQSKDQRDLTRGGGAQGGLAGGERFSRVYDVRDLVVSPPGVSGLAPTDEKGNLLRGVRETLGVSSTA
ncbi:MAG TPA: hypothetical protein DCX07_15055, partial [Phycisphaerales bacterium]|nr:hypothetical protein [Phycisphaerales bacterium]